MRLWHKDLIEFLPKEQLLGQWRELNSIFKRKNKHILINFVYDDYELDHLYSYATLVVCEMVLRGYRINQDNMMEFFKNSNATCLSIESIYKEKMDNRYLKQCLYNLQEKYDCGGITKEDWEYIENRFKEHFE